MLSSPSRVEGCRAPRLSRSPEYRILDWDHRGIATLPNGDYSIISMTIRWPEVDHPPPRLPTTPLESAAGALRDLATLLQSSLSDRHPETTADEVVDQVSRGPASTAYLDAISALETPEYGRWYPLALWPTTRPVEWLTRVEEHLREYLAPADTVPPWQLELTSHETRVDLYTPESLRVIQTLASVSSQVIPSPGWTGAAPLQFQWSGGRPAEIGVLLVYHQHPPPSRLWSRYTDQVSLDRLHTSYQIRHPIEWIYIPVDDGDQATITVDGVRADWSDEGGGIWYPSEYALDHGWFRTWALAPERPHPSGSLSAIGAQLQIDLHGSPSPGLVAYIRLLRVSSWEEGLYHPKGFESRT